MKYTRYFKFRNFETKERMKKLIIGGLALSLFAACASSKGSKNKTDEKAKTENPKPQKVQAEYEEM